MLVRLGPESETLQMVTERLDTSAAPTGASAVATATAQPVIAEQLAVEPGEWHGAPDRVLLDA